tara:strand:+ start:390 stop:548 length:159 start_codon:yes stop_codon:yes gene_type:complete
MFKILLTLLFMGSTESMKFDPISSLTQHTIKKVYDEKRVGPLAHNKEKNSKD